MRAIAKHKRGVDKKEPHSELLVSECARQLETLNEAALHQIRNGSPNGLVVDYRQLPEVSEDGWRRCAIRSLREALQAGFFPL